MHEVHLTKIIGFQFKAGRCQKLIAGQEVFRAHHFSHIVKKVLVAMMLANVLTIDRLHPKSTAY